VSQHHYGRWSSQAARKSLAQTKKRGNGLAWHAMKPWRGRSLIDVLRDRRYTCNHVSNLQPTGPGPLPKHVLAAGTGRADEDLSNFRTIMANTKSAKKAVRASERRTAINKNRRSRMRTFIRKVEEAIATGDKGVAETALRSAQPEIMRGAQKGVIHKNTASRKISRLSARIRVLAG
jgi:small subunit ribosomal protein S20